MYHPYRKPLALLAVTILMLGAVPAALAQTAAEPGPTAVSSLPDPVSFRVQMELGAIGSAQEWLAAGLPPDFMGDRIGSGLMIAAWEGHIPLMELFAAHGADVNKTNALGETALMHAAWKGRGEAVQWLLAHGARVGREAMQWTALHYAVFAGHSAIAELLLDRGADLDARSPNGSSVLMMAVYEGREDMARWLLARGADTRGKNENGDGALDWAMKFNHMKIARMVASRDEFVVVASRPKTEWSAPKKSEPVPTDIEELLNIRGILAARNLAVDKIDHRIAALRAQYARAGLKREAPPPAVLEISAERKAPGKQRARLVIEPAKAKAAGR
ncbi:MAG: hypothetical protein A2045_14220 [Rhodocyclales bacterium GWA2_65_20]|nr:MAG: hypothetical protein A2045_14220 [Rhodocyclales bacterium GWA2_65_20]